MSKYDNLEQVNLSTKSIEKNNSKKPQAALAVGLLAFTLFTSGCGNTEAEAIKQAENTPPTNESSETITPDDVTTMETPNGTLIITPEMEEQIAQDTGETEKRALVMRDLGTKSEMNIATEFSNGETVDYSKAPANLVESYSFKYLTAEQQAELIEMENMELSEFRKLPEQEQIKFAYWIFENNKPRFDAALKAYNINTKYKDVTETHGDITENFAYLNEFIAGGLYTQDPNDKKAGLNYNSDMGYKMYPLYRAQTYDNFGYQDYDRTIEFYNDQKQILMYEYKIDIIKSVNAKVDSKPGIITDVDLFGSEISYYSKPRKQAYFKLNPIKTIDNKDAEIVQLLDYAEAENAMELIEE